MPTPTDNHYQTVRTWYYNAHYRLYTDDRTLYSPHDCTVYTTDCTQTIVHCTVHTIVQCTLQTRYANHNGPTAMSRQRGDRKHQQITHNCGSKHEGTREVLMTVTTSNRAVIAASRTLLGNRHDSETTTTHMSQRDTNGACLPVRL